MDTNLNINTDTKPAVKRPNVVTIAAILLLVLSLFVTGLGIANQFGLLGRGFGNRQFLAGQGGNRNFTPPNGFQSNGSGFNGFPNAQNNQGTTPNATFNRTRATGLASLFRVLRPIALALDIILLVLSVVAAIGLFKMKRWAVILAIVISALVILLTIPGMLRIFVSINLVENLFRILVAVAVIVLLLLPSTRNAFATIQHGDESEVERVVR